MRNVTDVVKHLVIINVVVFLAVEILPAIMPNLNLFFPASDQFRPYQLVTHMFNHDHNGIMHIAFNMMTLFFLGPMVEHELGQQKFLALYLLSGFGAALAHMGVDYYYYSQLSVGADPLMLDEIAREGRDVILSGKNYVNDTYRQINEILNVPVVGASGAIYGVVIAFAVFFPNQPLMLMFIPVPIPAKYFAVGIIALDLFLGMGKYKTGVAHYAHLGGAITGFLLAYFVFRRTYNRY